MIFSYKDYAVNGIDYPGHFNRYKSVDTNLLKEMEGEFYKDGDPVERSFTELRRRITEDYWNKVHKVQTKALEYAKIVFPTYKFIMPDSIADDWLATVDWHKKYPSRDHSLHQTLTAYIVHKMLGGGNPNNALKLNRGSDNNMLDYCASRILHSTGMKWLVDFHKELCPEFDKQPDSFKQRWSRDIFYETAMVASLFHDMGYPWQYINGLKKAINVADDGFALDITGDAEQTLRQIKHRLLVYPFFGYLPSNINHPTPILSQTALHLINEGLKDTHGMPGALGFLSLNDRIRDINSMRKTEDANYRLVLEWAAVGIMMHDMAKIYWDEKGKKPKNPMLRLSFEVDPLSCLISLADMLEEFYRPSASFLKNKRTVNGEEKECVNLTYGFPCVASELKITGRRMDVAFYYENQGIANDQEHKEDEIFQYLNTNNGYIDLTPLGVKVLNWNMKDKSELQDV